MQGDLCCGMPFHPHTLLCCWTSFLYPRRLEKKQEDEEYLEVWSILWGSSGCLVGDNKKPWSAAGDGGNPEFSTCREAFLQSWMPQFCTRKVAGQAETGSFGGWKIPVIHGIHGPFQSSHWVIPTWNLFRFNFKDGVNQPQTRNAFVLWKKPEMVYPIHVAVPRLIISSRWIAEDPVKSR